MTVAIVTPVLFDGDAIGNDAIGMAAALRRAGHAVQFFADKARVHKDVFPLESLRGSLTADDAIIYHHSLRCDAAVAAMEWLPCRRKAVKYHNVTPPRFFAGMSKESEDGAIQGMKQAAQLANTSAALWVDSAFNARDINRACEELPPFHQTDKLLAIAPDADALGGLDAWATTLLCVGRVAPNKNLLLAIDTLAEYRATYEPQARLVVAGEHMFAAYSTAVSDRIRDRGLDRHVIATGRVTLGQLKALYLTADALLVTSEHEGFCVPLVEAMALGVPTVAVPTTAIPDTAGDAAVYAPATASALAEAIHRIVSDKPLRELHLNAGRKRYAGRFTTAAMESRFLALFETLPS